MLKLVLLFTVSFQTMASMEVVDVEFHGFDKHIAIELTTVGGEDALEFKLASNLTNRTVAISKCVYTQTSLEREINNIQDQKVRADFSWVFIRSDYAGTPVVQFFPEFKALLE